MMGGALPENDLFPPRLESPCWKGLGADSEEKHERCSGDGLKVASDPNLPIREADTFRNSGRDACLLINKKKRGSGRVEGRAIKQGGDIGRRDGLAEQVALPLCASIGLETCQLPGVFDALGRRRQAKSLCKAEDRADDHLAVFALVETRHEAPVNLDLVEMK